MTTGILINVRLGSKRLPRKHLIKINGITYIEILIKRLLYSFSTEVEQNDIIIIINTSCKKENNEFDLVFKYYKNIEVFHGNNENIPYRQLRCSEQFNLDKIISICGDNFLVSMDATRAIYDKLMSGSEIIKTSGLPIGLNVAGYTYEYLRKSLENIPENKKVETGWYSVFPKMDEIKLGSYTLHDSLRFTLDYPDDSKFVTKVIKHFDNIYEVSDDIILNTVIKHKYYLINSHLKEIYWKNFNKGK